MKKTFKNYQNTLFFITILFFVIGIFNITFAVAGMLCFILPFVQYNIYKDKVWCKYYCPRAGLFTVVFSKIGLKKKLPKFLTGKRIKTAVVVYFSLNLFFATMSTIMVSLGNIAPIDYVRFLMAFRAPFTLPQILDIQAADWLVHVGYRVYSMMFTSVVIGLILGFIYAPRTWCIICPIQTLTTKKKKVDNKG